MSYLRILVLLIFFVLSSIVVCQARQVFVVGDCVYTPLGRGVIIKPYSDYRRYGRGFYVRIGWVNYWIYYLDVRRCYGNRVIVVRPHYKCYPRYHAIFKPKKVWGYTHDHHGYGDMYPYDRGGYGDRHGGRRGRH